MFDAFLKSVEDRLPDRPSRRELADVTKLFSPRTLANMDAAGKGIGGMLYGKRVLYEKSAVLVWLRQYLEGHARRAGSRLDMNNTDVGYGE